MASGGRRRKSRGGARPKAKRRTKYLRLSRIIVKAEVDTPPRSPEEDDDGPAPSPSPSPPTASEVKKEDDGGQQQQAEPFAVHHEASTLFAAFPAPSLSDILGASASIAGGGSDESTPSPSSSPGTAGLPGAEEEDLARRALRGRERWVYCRSSSSSPPPTTTATATATSSASPCSSAASTGASARSLLLKLDYADVMAAWADRGPLYIGDGHAAPKPKPGPELDNVSPFLLKAPPSPWGRKRSVRAVLGGVRGGDTDGGSSPSVPVFVEVEPPPHAAACAWRSAPQETVESERAERVRRYKEKRLNRLFAKRIRYEVRRVNAVKRPRFKGRFIKEHEEIEVELT